MRLCPPPHATPPATLAWGAVNHLPPLELRSSVPSTIDFRITLNINMNLDTSSWSVRWYLCQCGGWLSAPGGSSIGRGMSDGQTFLLYCAVSSPPVARVYSWGTVHSLLLLRQNSSSGTSRDRRLHNAQWLTQIVNPMCVAQWDPCQFSWCHTQLMVVDAMSLLGGPSED